MSIVSAIMSMRTRVHVHVDGIAASMGAVIAVAADKVYMMDFAKMMVHDPYFLGPDSSKVTDKEVKMLAKLTDMLRQVLSRKGKNDEEMAKLMREETWFSADEAKDAGLCDEVVLSSRDKYKNMAPLQLVAAIEADYELNNNKQMDKFTLTAEATIALGINTSEPDAQTVSSAVMKLQAAKEQAEKDKQTVETKLQELQDKIAADRKKPMP